MNDEPEGVTTESRGLIATARELIGEFQDDDVPGMSAEVAYHAIFSIPPLLVVFVTLAAVINEFSDFDLAGRMQEMIESDAPESTRDILEALITNAVERVDGGAASVGLAAAVLIALWAGSNGVAALIKAFNRAYDTGDERPFVKKRGLAILLTIVLGLIVNLSLMLWVFGRQIGEWIAKQFGMGGTFELLWDISRWPLGTLIIVLMLTVLYYFAPNVDQMLRWVLPGALLSTVLWFVLVFGFSIYLQFANPGSAYGALGGLIVFLFFLYLTALIFIVGAELNAILARRHDAVMIEDLGIESEGAAVALTTLPALPSRSTPTTGQLAVGALTTLGIVIIGLVTRRSSE